MLLEIVIVRHGQSEGNRDQVFTGHSPSPLTELGRRQAEATAERISLRPVDLIYASDLPRAMQTAEPLVGRTGAPFVTDAALRERDIGELTGMTFAELEAQRPDIWKAIMARDPSFRPPGGESSVDCRARVGAFLDGLFSRHEAGRIVIFTHGIAINQMLYHLMALVPEVMPPVVFQIENCSVQRIERRSDGTRRIACINDTAHLATLAIARSGTVP
ncbi:histidine phosphatase family protein [Polyangium aurulentum]|uniref:histidine phosphatase family protein n=1 Tax=Polyangium aurulentum TaxID=2567896 RepID=UPI00146C027D|nr:histidine phosphatase family protein [Polyangium aurulentum]UQA62722.1 histidine phosphatase family protein [Polyangium aurulentum]